MDRRLVAWPATLQRWGATPVVGGPLIPCATGSNPAFFGVPWHPFDLGWYSGSVRSEPWLVVGPCGARLAVHTGKVRQAALWSALVGVVDPLGLVVGLGAGAWALYGAVTRHWPSLEK